MMIQVVCTTVLALVVVVRGLNVQNSYAHSSCPKVHVHQLARSVTSQFGEDYRVMEDYFPGVCNGTYMELGAMSGVMYSNTLALNTQYNWRGVLIEGSPINFAALKDNRKKRNYPT